MSELIQRTIDRDELLDIAIDIGALTDYVVMLNGGHESRVYERILSVQARLMIELGQSRRDDEGEIDAIDPVQNDSMIAAESRRTSQLVPGRAFGLSPDGEG
jgi:hypothetical protein